MKKLILKKYKFYKFLLYFYILNINKNIIF